MKPVLVVVLAVAACSVPGDDQIVLRCVTTHYSDSHLLKGTLVDPSKPVLRWTEQQGTVYTITFDSFGNAEISSVDSPHIVFSGLIDRDEIKGHRQWNKIHEARIRISRLNGRWFTLYFAEGEPAGRFSGECNSIEGRKF